MAQGQRADKEALRKSNLDTLRQMFARMTEQLRAALPRFITPERMIRVATTNVQRVPKLLECQPVTVVGALMQAAALGLEPDNIVGSAYMVPFWNSNKSAYECTLIPGYRGLMQLARRSRDISVFDAHVVKAGDLFDFEYGSTQYVKHKPATALALKEGKWQAQEKEPETVAAYMIAFYNGAKLADGRPPFQFHVMTRGELEKAKQTTKSRDKQNNIVGPWAEHPDAMYTKTVIRRGAKLLPFSIELQTAIALDEKAIAGKSQNLGAIVAGDLGVDFQATDDDETETGEGGDAGESGIDPELVRKLDAGFAALSYTEAQKTVKMQEFRGRLPELLEWLDAERARNAKPVNGTVTTNTPSNNAGAQPVANGASNAGEGSTPSVRSASPASTTPAAPPRRSPSRKFTI
jgi:recombination protein RecT